MKNVQRRMQLIPNGMIHSPFQTNDEAPRQGRFSGEECTIEISEQFS
jgi:tRNA (Thr-GGU) A37 N-methylase